MAGIWPWGAREDDAKVDDALAEGEAAYAELVEVVSELESLVARLSKLPEVQAARHKNRMDSNE